MPLTIAISVYRQTKINEKSFSNVLSSMLRSTGKKNGMKSGSKEWQNSLEISMFPQKQNLHLSLEFVGTFV